MPVSRSWYAACPPCRASPAYACSSKEACRSDCSRGSICAGRSVHRGAHRRQPAFPEAQELLAELGYLAPELVSGEADDATAVAVLEFQKWTGLPRDGVLGEATLQALERAMRPRPVTLVPGRHVEILLDRQLALLVDDGRVVRAVHISSGAGGRTPAGAFRVYRKERLSWSVPFEVWMPWASYFTGGIALHEYPIVPTYPASHGCVRVNRDAPFLYEFATYRTPVVVLPTLDESLGRRRVLVLGLAATAAAASPATKRPGG